MSNQKLIKGKLVNCQEDMNDQFDFGRDIKRRNKKMAIRIAQKSTLRKIASILKENGFTAPFKIVKISQISEETQELISKYDQQVYKKDYDKHLLKFREAHAEELNAEKSSDMDGVYIAKNKKASILEDAKKTIYDYLESIMPEEITAAELDQQTQTMLDIFKQEAIKKETALLDAIKNKKTTTTVAPKTPINTSTKPSSSSKNRSTGDTSSIFKGINLGRGETEIGRGKRY